MNGIRIIASSLLASLLAMSSFSCRPESGMIQVDPDIRQSFESLQRAHPLPAGYESRLVGDSGEGKRATEFDSAGFFAERVPSRFKNMLVKRLPDYRLVPAVKWGDVDARSIPPVRSSPLRDLRLPDLLGNVMDQGTALLGASGPVPVLVVSKSAPKSLKDWFDSIPDSDDRIVTIAAVGDIMLERGGEKILREKGGLEKLFGDTLPILRNADFCIGNLEGPVTTGGRRAKKLYTFRFSPDVVPKLKDAGFDYLSLCNNHSFDYGKAGFLDSLENLAQGMSEGTGPAYSGAGLDLEEAMRPYSARISGQPLSVISFGAFRPEIPAASITAAAAHPGILMEEGGFAALKAMTSLTEAPAINIVYVHTGIEYQESPNAKQLDLYHDCVDEGADLVLGAHPHVVQGVQAYKGALIAYSLGNFVFPGMDGKRHATDSIILKIGLFRGRVVAVDPVFVKITAEGPRLDPDVEGRSARFYRQCRELDGGANKCIDQ